MVKRTVAALLMAWFLAMPGFAATDPPMLLVSPTGLLSKYRLIAPKTNVFGTDGGALGNYVLETFKYSTQSSSPITLAATDSTTQAITTGASTFTVNLTACNGTNMANKLFLIKKADSGAGKVSIVPNATNSDTVDGASTYTLVNQYDYVVIQSDGANPGKWVVLGSNVSKRTTFNIISKSSSFAVNDGAGTYYYVTSSATATLPASPGDGSVRKFKCTSGTLTFAFNGAETINHANGTSDQTLTLSPTSGVIELTAVSGGWDET